MTAPSTFPSRAPSARRRSRGVVAILLAGLVSTIAVAVAAVVARGTIADHVRSGYPAYTDGEIDTAATTYVTYLVVLGVLGVVGWATTLWAVRRGTTWSRWLAAGFWLVGITIALFNLTIRDTSGDTGMPTTVGVLGIVPCVIGLVAVAMLWKRDSIERR